MISTIYNTPKDEPYHYGVKGMKWGVRRYQNEDGTLTEAGRKHYHYGDISIKQEGDGFIIATDKQNRSAKISSDAFHGFEKELEDMVVAALANEYGVDVNKFKKKMTSTKIKDINDSIDLNMESTLQSAIDSASKTNIKAVNKKSSSNKPKYTQRQAINKAYKDLEAKYPNFNKFSQDKQDKLFFDYLNKSGLYEYI